jgi:hypothetical protein
MTEQVHDDAGNEGADDKTNEIQKQIEAAVAKATEGLAAKNSELLGELKTERAARRDAEGKLDGVDIEAVKKMVADSEAAKLEQQKKEGKWDEILAKRDEAHAAKFGDMEAKLSARAEKTEGFAQKVLIDAQLSTALAQANIAPHFLKAVTSMVRAAISVRADDDAYFVPYVDVEGTELSVADYVKVWAEGDEGKHFVLAPTSGGGGMTGKPGAGKAGQVNPWKKETRNLTQQGQILKSDPQLAARLKREAGVA